MRRRRGSTCHRLEEHGHLGSILKALARFGVVVDRAYPGMMGFLRADMVDTRASHTRPREVLRRAIDTNVVAHIPHI